MRGESKPERPARMIDLGQEAPDRAKVFPALWNLPMINECLILAKFFLLPALNPAASIFHIKYRQPPESDSWIESRIL